MFFFFFSSRRRHTRFKCDWSSDVCSSDLAGTISEEESSEQPQPIGQPQEAAEPQQAEPPQTAQPAEPAASPAERLPTPIWFWLVFAAGIALIALIYALMSWERLEVFKLLLASFFPLAFLILSVLGSIVFGL